MVEWIVKRAQGDRARVGTLTGVVCILANVALCAAKGAIGVVSGSVSIVADAMNNLSDASSNIVSVLGFKLASKPPTRASIRPWSLRVPLGSCRGGARASHWP